MEIEALAERVQEHYLEQFSAFAAEQMQTSTKCASEVKLQLHPESELFQQLYCVDVIKNDPPELIELQPDRILSFEPFSADLGDAKLRIEHLRWDDVLIYHDARKPLKGIDYWFAQWFDLEENRLDVGADFSNAIHSLLLQPSQLSVDFGSAPAVAFRELLDLLRKADAKNIRVTSSRAEADNA